VSEIDMQQYNTVELWTQQAMNSRLMRITAETCLRRWWNRDDIRQNWCSTSEYCCRRCCCCYQPV